MSTLDAVHTELEDGPISPPAAVTVAATDLAAEGSGAEATSTPPPLPMFFYGTLQTGFKNHSSVIRGRYIASFPACMNEASLYHLDGFPGVRLHACGSGQGRVVHGELFLPPTETTEYRELMRDLDILEEYYGPGDARNVYSREVREVLIQVPGEVAPRAVQAQVYECLLDVHQPQYIHIPEGNWKTFMTERCLDDKGDDWKVVLEH